MINYRLDISDLFRVLDDWDSKVARRILLIACGGTALTLYGHKESTKDIDFVVPDPAQERHLLSLLEEDGYVRATGHGFKHPLEPWIFDFFVGNRVFQTDLLDPLQLPGNHRVFRKLKRITVGCLNPADLVISKMFRGDALDVDDSIIMIESENLDMKMFAERYHETAGYYYNPPECKRNLGYLIDGMKNKEMDTTELERIISEWTA